MSEEPQNQVKLLKHELSPTGDSFCSLDTEGHCITCSDEAVQVHVLSVNQESGLARVALDDLSEEIDVTLVERVEPGDTLLVHGGVAIARVDEASDA